MPLPTILVCDDDPGLRLLLRLAIEPRGYRLVDARDGATCLRLAARLQPDLVLIDMNLPDMSGSAVVAGIRRDPSLSGTPLLVATGSALEPERDLVGELRVDGLLIKPFSLDDLVAEVDRLLARRTLQAGDVRLRRAL
ncbi:MAG: response regulator, partial [Gaiellaceae bacterium]